MFNLVTEIIAWSGGSAVIAGGVATFTSKLAYNRWLESHKSDLEKEVERLKADLAKEQETHKLLLRRREILFSREIDAAKAFFQLRQRVTPGYSYPDKEWADVIEEIIEDFGKIQKELENFLRDHGPFLTPDIRTLVDKAEALSGKFKFHASGHGSGSNKEAETAAGTIRQSLSEIEQGFANLLRS